MPEMTNIRGQDFEKPKNNYHCMKCSNRVCFGSCFTCDDGSNFKPYKTWQPEDKQKEGEKKNE
jgi:tRNA G10  N-methylase Trm11